MATPRVVAGAPDGSFCLLHDTWTTSALTPGLLRYTNADSADRLRGPERRSLSQAQAGCVGDRGGRDPATPSWAVCRPWCRSASPRWMRREKAGPRCAARLEADFVRRFIELREDRG
ncbi:MAG: hypothetical protein R3A10_19900 [Caldilineaceae bacterium]